jgi:Co/Zn/Cd efflux system component
MNHIRQTRGHATRHARFYYGVTRAQVVTSACWGVLLLAWGVQAAVEALLA